VGSSALPTRTVDTPTPGRLLERSVISPPSTGLEVADETNDTYRPPALAVGVVAGLSWPRPGAWGLGPLLAAIRESARPQEPSSSI